MSSANRGERRRAARQAMADVGVTGVFTETGFVDTGSAGQLPAKVSGKHRWIATCAYILTEDQVRNEQRTQTGDTSGGQTHLDHETRLDFAIGCWDCELPFPTVTPDTPCAGDPSGRDNT